MVRHRSGTMGDITLTGPNEKSRGLKASQLQSYKGENNNPTHKNTTLTKNTNKNGTAWTVYDDKVKVLPFETIHLYRILVNHI